MKRKRLRGMFLVEGLLHTCAPYKQGACAWLNISIPGFLTTFSLLNSKIQQIAILNVYPMNIRGEKINMT